MSLPALLLILCVRYIGKLREFYYVKVRVLCWKAFPCLVFTTLVYVALVVRSTPACVERLFKLYSLT